MPSAPSIRKQLLRVLEESVLPALQDPQELRMVVASLPIHIPEGLDTSHLPIPLLPDNGPDIPRFGTSWPHAHVHNIHCPCIMFLCEGEADVRVGVTEGMAGAAASSSMWTRSGCHVLHLKAPTVLVIPAGTPYSDGTKVHWENPEVPAPSNQIFWLRLFPSAAFCHVCSTSPAGHKSSHPLQIMDKSLLVSLGLVEEELEQRTQDHETVARIQLLSLFMRTRRRLTLDPPEIGNTAWQPEPKLELQLPDGEPATNAHRAIKEADEFIQTHLREPIMLPQIAAYCGISPTHLNRTFNSVFGMSVKRYVTRRRVSAAQDILRISDLSIKEVASLVGFSQASHFCQVFQKVQGMSPTRYRSQIKSAPPASITGCPAGSKQQSSPLPNSENDP